MSKHTNALRKKSPWLNDRQDHELESKKTMAILLYQQGATRRQIAEQVGVTHSSVKNWVDAWNKKQKDTNHEPE